MLICDNKRFKIPLSDLLQIGAVEKLQRPRVAENHVFHLFKRQACLDAGLQNFGSL